MPRRRRPRALPSGDRDRLLAEEVLHLHSLWRRGPPVPVPVPVPVSVPVPVPVPVSVPAPIPVPVPAPIPPRGSGSLATRRRAAQRKRRRIERLAQPHDPGSEWPLAPSPPASPTIWPDASEQPQLPPPRHPSPGSLAQRAALRAAEEFFSRHSSGDDDEGSESEGEDGGEEGAAGFFLGVFERDAALRGYYERSCEDGEFMCMACVGRKVRRGMARRFRDCVGLVQHARAATRCGRPRAHRALAAAVCRVLGWDIERLPSVVIDPRGTLGQALATGATIAGQEDNVDTGAGENDGSSSDEDVAEEDVDTGKNDSSLSDGDAEKEDVDARKNDGSLSDGDAAKEDVDMGKSGSSSNDNNGEVHEQENGEESAEKEDTEDINSLSSKETSINEELCKAVQEEEDAINNKQEHAKGADHTRDTGIMIIRLGNNSSKEEAATENKEEHAKNIGDTGDHDIASLGNNYMDSSKS